jgi:hypothetical protein
MFELYFQWNINNTEKAYFLTECKKKYANIRENLFTVKTY